MVTPPSGQLSHRIGRGRTARPLLFLLLSSLAHGAALAGLAGLVGTFSVPRVQVTWLDADNTLGAPRPREVARDRPSGPAPSKPAPAPPRPPREKPRPAASDRAVATVRSRPDAGMPLDAGPARASGSIREAGAGTPRFTAEKTVLTELAPGDAALILLLRTDRIRRSPYEQSVRRLLEAFYDYKTILWSSGIDPVTDLDGVLIATPNPYRVTETFLAARHRLPLTKIRRALERSCRYGDRRVRWIRGVGGLRGEIPSPPRLTHDPRVLLVQQGVIMLTDPRHIPLLTVSPPAPTPDGGTGSETWIARLGLMGEQGGKGSDAPGLLLQAVNLPRLVALPPDLPAPVNLQVIVPPQEPARVEALLTFASPTLAETFVTALPRRIERAKQSVLFRLLGVVELLDSIAFKRTGSAVSASAQLGGDQVRGLLEVFRQMIPQVRVPGMPDRAARDGGPPRAPDAGATRSPPDAGPRRDTASAVTGAQ